MFERIRTREACASDLDQVVSLVVAFWREHDRIAGQQVQRDPVALAEEVREHLGGTESGYLVAEQAGRLVGFRRWALHEGFYFTREMVVEPELRRQGVARLLIRSFEEWLLARGQDIACISVVPRNTAMIDLARSAGYDTLNMIEIRKDLGPTSAPRGSAEKALGLEWKTVD